MLLSKPNFSLELNQAQSHFLFRQILMNSYQSLLNCNIPSFQSFNFLRFHIGEIDFTVKYSKF